MLPDTPSTAVTPGRSKLSKNQNHRIRKGGANQSTQIGVGHHDGTIGVEPVELTGKRGGGVYAAQTTPRVDLRTKHSWEDTC